MNYRGRWKEIYRLSLIFVSFLVLNGAPQVSATGFTPHQIQTTDDSKPDWTQFGQNASHTNFAPQTISQQVSFAWDWNSANKEGKSQADHLKVADLIQPITGGERVYMVADNAVYALDQASGEALWSYDGIGTLTGTPVYLNETLYVGSENGKLYQLDASDGKLIQSVDLGGSITTALISADSTIVATTANGSLVAVDAKTLKTIWKYDAGVELVTMPAFSAKQNVIIVVGKDLYVHAVDATSGKQKWRVKPTVRDYTTEKEETNYAVADNGWPVIAEQHGLVFIRYRLEWNTIWAFGEYPNSNAEIRNILTDDPSQQALFALSLDDGKTAFVPAVGNGGEGDGGTLSMGPLPVIKQVDGQEVAYIMWRNGQTCVGCDGREDATMGEMVLDDRTMPDYTAGDVRFVQFDDIQTDEMQTLSMVGDVLFRGHWLVDAGRRIGDRSAKLGDKFTNPIKTSDGLYIIWRQCQCPAGQNCNPVLYPGGSGTTSCGVVCPFNADTRYCPAGLYSYGDTRGYPAGFYQYHNDIQHTYSLPFTIASGNMVIVKTDDGGLMAFSNDGSRSQEVKPVLVSNPMPPPESLTWELPTIASEDAMQYVGQIVKVCGTINSVVDHLPKAVYMSFTTVHDGQMMVRVFRKDLSKFSYDPMTLLDKNICVSGLMRLYYPEMNAPEIIVEDQRLLVVK